MRTQYVHLLNHRELVNEFLSELDTRNEETVQILSSTLLIHDLTEIDR